MKPRFLTRWTRTTMKTRRVIDMTRGAHALTRGARRKTLGQRISTLAYWFSRYRSLSLSFHHRFTGRTECSAYVSTLCKREYRFLTAAAKRALPSSCQKRGARGPHATRILSLSLFLSRSPTLSTRFVIAVYSTISRHASPRLPCFFDPTGSVVRSRDAFRTEMKFIEFVFPVGK